MRLRSFRVLIILSAMLATQASQGASPDDAARAAVQKDLMLLKRGGDTLARTTIEDCYRKISSRSRIADVEACFMLDAVNNRMDQAVRQNIGMSNDPTGFHNDADLLLRVSVPFARIGVEGSNVKALLMNWSAAVSAAMRE